MITRYVLLLAAAIVLGLVLFPPFVHRKAQYEESLGYSFILSPPQYRLHLERLASGYERANPFVNTPLLLTEVAVVLVITGLVVVALPRTKDNNKPKVEKKA